MGSGFLGFGGSDSNATNTTLNTSTNNTMGTTGAQSPVTRQGNASMAGNSGLAISGVSGSKNNVSVTNVSNDLGADVAKSALEVSRANVSGGYSLINGLTDKISGLFTGVMDVTKQNLNNASETQAAVLQSNNSTIAALQELGKINATGGQSETNKTILSIVGLAIGGLALIFFFTRKP